MKNTTRLALALSSVTAIGAGLLGFACSSDSSPASPTPAPTTTTPPNPTPTPNPIQPDAGTDAAMSLTDDLDGKGPGATLACTSSGKNAWQTFGASAFIAVNEQIFANVATESTANGTTNLGSAFTKVGTGTPPATMDALPAFKGSLAAFLVYAYGGPANITYSDGQNYYGPQDMAAAHVGLGITSSQFDYFVTNIVVPALTAKGVTSGDVTSCFAPVLTNAAFKATIINDGAGTGKGAALKCESSGTNAFATYGAAAFVAVNEQIFTNVLADKTGNLGPSFGLIGSGKPPSTADGLASFKGNLAAFLVYTYGGPSSITYTDNVSYDGPQDMTESHLGLGITGAQYDYFVTNIVVPALKTKGVKAGAGGAADPNDVSTCFAPALVDAAFKASIVGH